MITTFKLQDPEVEDDYTITVDLDSRGWFIMVNVDLVSRLMGGQTLKYSYKTNIKPDIIMTGIVRICQITKNRLDIAIRNKNYEFICSEWVPR